MTIIKVSSVSNRPRAGTVCTGELPSVTSYTPGHNNAHVSGSAERASRSSKPNTRDDMKRHKHTKLPKNKRRFADCAGELQFEDSCHSCTLSYVARVDTITSIKKITITQMDILMTMPGFVAEVGFFFLFSRSC